MLNKYNLTRKKIRRFLFVIALTIASVTVSLILFDYVCLFKHTTGISCPGCGMTRAYSALFHGDISGALTYHPLFMLAPVLVVYIVLYTMRPTHRREIILFVIAGIFLLTWFIRLCGGWLPA